MAVLSQRLERFGLTLHPQKTRLLDFHRPPRSRGEGRSPTTFDFLGFCWYWRRTRTGSWNEVFPNAACVVTLVDRLVHRSEILAVAGDSYRLKEAQERAAQRSAKRATGKKAR